MQTIEPPSTMPFDGAIYAGFGTIEIVLLIILIGSLLASALISGSEAAFFSLSPTDKEDLKTDESKSAQFVTKLLNKPKDLLATILIINNFVNVGIVILSSFLLTSIYFHEDNDKSGFQFFIEVIVITLVLLLLGEVIPKIYATKNAKRFAKMMGRPLFVIDKTPPVSWIRSGLVKGSSFIQKRAKKGKVDISSDELEQALALTKVADDNEEDHKILEGIVKFGNTEVRQIMKPRLDVHALDSSISFDEVMELILDCGHSRIPVYEETFDKILGVLFIKDLLPFLGNEEKVDWLSLIRKPIFVPENKKIDDLLKEFQEKKVHIAMVVDEYGGTSGIVTLEDILEEIVGDITDEFDDDEIVYTKIDEDTYLFEGKTALIDFFKVMSIDEQEDDFDSKTAETLGGFIVEHAGRILKNNEFIEVGNLKFVVESSDKKRIKMIKATKNSQV
ncbi:MAG: gliding motility-associated protein GldE [Crocinitomicaceae bacterium]|nr:gliding motility-associated protein GldE [Crocinitomicaceae bacterium]